MSRHPTNSVLLDALLLDSLTAEEKQAVWAQLLEDPAADEAWWRAVERRRKLDALASLTRGREWLARAILQVRQAGRRMPYLPGALIRLEAPALLGAQLGPAGDQVHPAQKLIWGKVETRFVALGQSLRLRGPADVLLTAVHAGAGGQGALPTCGWTLEQGESPVLLLAGLRAPAGLSTIDELIRQAEAVAGVVLVEAGETAEPADSNRET